MKYQRVVFFQGEEAIEPLELWDEDYSKALEYMLQWDNGDGEIFDYPSAGQGDYTKDLGEYRITYHLRLGYIGLERMIND